MKMKTWILVFLAVALTLTACGAERTAVGAASLEGEWTLLTLNGAPLLAGSTINVTFEEGKITGYSGCNSYGGTYTVKGAALQLGEMAMTAMDCLEDGVMEQEQTYMAALLAVAKVRLDHDRLELLDASGATLLAYVRQEAFTGDPAALGGTEWQLLTFDGSPLDETLPFTLAFTEDRYSGLAGCRHFEGDYQAGDGEIGFPMMAMIEETCPHADDVYWGLEGRFTDALSWARHWRIADGQLQIRTVRGEVLVFAPYTPLPEVSLAGTTWSLTAFIAGETTIPLLADTEITLTFEAGQASGSAGCNNYFAPYTLERGVLRFGAVGMTKMFCVTPEGAMDQEARYADILSAATLFEWDANQLTLRTADGRGLVFAAQR